MKSSRTSYDQKANVLSRHTDYELHNDGLAMRSEGKDSRWYPYSELRLIRLRYHPTRVQRNRYVCDLQWTRSRRFQLSNEHYRGIYDFEDRSEAYRGFIEQLCLNVSNIQGCQFEGGNSKISNLVIWLCYFLGMGMLLLVALILATTLPFLILVQIAIILFYTPTLFRYARKNRSQNFDPLAISKNLLP